jgi:hypothetical protein
VTCENNGLVERLLECEKKLGNLEDDLKTWTDSLEELSEIEGAFVTGEKNSLDGKTILDVGTDCVKPLYIALKFKPKKIIGIGENLSVYSFASDLEQKSKLLTETKIRFYYCNLFDKATFDRILNKEGIDKRFDFVLVSKTLHHLRTGKCKRKRDRKHNCEEDEEYCTYGFEEQAIFEKLLGLGKRVIIYEYFDPSHTDNDKIRGRGGYFTRKEWKIMFEYLSRKHKVEFIQPERFHLDKETLGRVEPMLKQVDCICFYIED